jgi:hypothetical protein
MSSKAGPKNYTVYVTDISGAPVTGADMGWMVTGRVNTEIIDSGVIEEIGNGFYFSTITAPNGTGFVKISNTNTAWIITPSYFVIDDNINDTDDIFAQQQITNTNLNIVKGIVSSLRIGSQEAASCFCLGPPLASQPPADSARLAATVYPNIFNYSL